MAKIVRLRPDEAVKLDADRLERLCRELGVGGAEAVACRAMEEIGLRLDKMRTARDRGDAMAFAGHARSLGRVAAQVGLGGLSRVARDAGTCATSRGAVEAEATWHRLERLGETALSGVWNLHDISL